MALYRHGPILRLKGSHADDQPGATQEGSGRTDGHEFYQEPHEGRALGSSRERHAEESDQESTSPERIAMRHPDRFEKMAEQEYKKWLHGDMSQRGWLEVAERCQRRQYAELRRLVRQASSFGQVDQGAKGEWVLRDDILDAMDRWKQKGLR